MIQMYKLIFVLILFFIAIYFSAYSHGSPTCSRFILNTYMYVFGGILYTFMICRMFLEKDNFGYIKIMNISSKVNKWILLIGQLIIMFFLVSKIYSVSVKQLFWKHFYFILFLTFFGIILFPYVMIFDFMPLEAIGKILVIFFGIIVIASAMAVYFPDFIDKLYFPLILSLVGLILYYLFYSFLGLGKYVSYRNSLMVSVVLFSFFVSYDTKILLDRQSECVEGKADYVKYSLQLYIDFINILTDLLQLFSRN